MPEQHDAVNHPSHYTSHPSGIECIEITEHMSFNLGNAVKYIWRADLKADAIEDLEKARWYLTREIEKRQRTAERTTIEVAPEDAKWCVADTVEDASRGNGVWAWTRTKPAAEFIKRRIEGFRLHSSTPEKPHYSLPPGGLEIFPVRAGQVVR